MSALKLIAVVVLAATVTGASVHFLGIRTCPRCCGTVSQAPLIKSTTPNEMSSASEEDVGATAPNLIKVPDSADNACPECCSKNLSRAGLLAAAAQKDGASAPVEFTTVKLPQLLKEIQNQPDKVVIVDVWADFCLPCKKGFPHLVDMHRRFAKDGLVCVSVCVDEVKDRAGAFKFLKKQEAAFPNYLLDEVPDVWQDHWNIKAIPAVFLYQDGRKVAQFDYDDPDNQFTYDDVEKAVVKMLRK